MVDLNHLVQDRNQVYTSSQRLHVNIERTVMEPSEYDTVDSEYVSADAQLSFYVWS